MRLLRLVGVVCVGLGCGLFVVGGSAVADVRVIPGDGTVFTPDLAAGRQVPQQPLPLRAISVDHDGSFFGVVDSQGRLHELREGNLVLKVSADGSCVSRFAGSFRQGSRIFEDSAIYTELNGLQGVAVGSDGSVFVTANSGVLKFSGDGTHVERFAGTDPPQQGNKIDSRSALATQFNGPQGIAVGGDGLVFIADTGNNRVLKVSGDGREVSVVAGVGNSGAVVDSNNPGKTQLHSPQDVAVNSVGDVFIADTGNHRVLKVSDNGRYITRFAGSDQEGAYLNERKNAQFSELSKPEGVAVAANGDVFIADTGNHRVLLVSGDGEHVSRFAGVDRPGNRVDENDAACTQLSGPSSVAVRTDGMVAIADRGNSRLLFVSPEDNKQATEKEITDDNQLALVVVEEPLETWQTLLANTDLFTNLHKLSIEKTGDGKLQGQLQHATELSSKVEEQAVPPGQRNLDKALRALIDSATEKQDE